MSDHKQNVNWQPISFLPQIAEMIDGMLESAEENYQNLLKAKEEPHIMDDYTVDRVFEVYGNQKADFWPYDKQLQKWTKKSVTSTQLLEIKRLQNQMIKLKKIVNQNLDIAKYLKDKTIEKIMEKDDVELAMEFLMGKMKI